MISHLAQSDAKFEICDKTYYFGDKEMKNTYLKQVQSFNNFVQSHRIIRIHGFSQADITEASNELLRIPNITGMEVTSQSLRRGMYALLAKSDIPIVDIDQIDDVCARFNQ